MSRWQSLSPLSPDQFAKPEIAKSELEAIAQSGASDDLLSVLWGSLAVHLDLVDDPVEAVSRLRQFIEVSRSPTSLLALFERDTEALPALLQVLSTSPAIAKLLLSDPESFDLIRASDGQPAQRDLLVDELVSEVRSIHSTRRVALAIRRFAGREILRIAYGEFVRGLPPDKVGQQISHVTDAVLTASLQHVIQQVSEHHPPPQRIDSSLPRYAIIALGNYGGQELGYESPLDLLLVCDQVDRKNASHVEFNHQIAKALVELLHSDHSPVISLDLRFRHNPVDDFASSTDTHRLGVFSQRSSAPHDSPDFFDVEEAASHFERANQTWQRLAFVKARLAAGDEELGKQLLHRLQPWVYHHLLSRSEIADIRVLRRKLEKRALSSEEEHGLPVAEVPGGRRDIELTIAFLQLLHGSDLVDVRVTNTLEAIGALSRHGCLTQQEATLLSENHARLCRLEHYLAVLFERKVTHLPDENELRQRLAWRLGVRHKPDPAQSQSDQPRLMGNTQRFEALLHETFDVNRKIINHLMVDEVQQAGNGMLSDEAEVENVSVAIETELILDPSPDLNLFRATLENHGFQDPDAAMHCVIALSHETVSFLSPRRCRHFFANVAPFLLREIAETPNPDATLAKLVEVTDSIGAKATLWELLRTNQATLSLMVQLCSLTPYLSGILIEHPGMVDELIDSLVMDRLPSAERLDTLTQRLCDGADELKSILMNFKASAHLMIGVRDLLGKESIDAIGKSLSDTAEACLRRVIESEQEALAARYGDPVDESGEPVEMVGVAFGKFGGREPNYHSDLDLTFLYTSEGQTQRRVGGPRSTLSNRQFFNQLSQNIIRRVDSSTEGRLFELDLPLARGTDEAVLSMSVSAFTKPFLMGAAPLWQRVLLCQARAFSGSRSARSQTEQAIKQALSSGKWRDGFYQELRTWRERTESTASPGNLKRGRGGTLDVHWIAAAAMLRITGGEIDAETNQQEWPIGTVACLESASSLGLYDSNDTNKLIENYRFLRTVEAKLRLINTASRHELPLGPDGDPKSTQMQQLAGLMSASSADDAFSANDIVDRCDAARQSNRLLFDKLVPPK